MAWDLYLQNLYYLESMVNEISLYIIGYAYFGNTPENLDSRFVLKSLSIAALM